MEPEEEAKRFTAASCANCGKMGHRWDRCPSPATICVLCGAYGHGDNVRRKAWYPLDGFIMVMRVNENNHRM